MNPFYCINSIIMMDSFIHLFIYKGGGEISKTTKCLYSSLTT